MRRSKIADASINDNDLFTFRFRISESNEKRKSILTNQEFKLLHISLQIPRKT